MNCQQKSNDMNTLLFINTLKPSKTKASAARPEKNSAAKSEKKEEKRHFTSLITKENDLKLASFQKYKPGGAKTTDILNDALAMYFESHKQWSQAYLKEKK